jgi:hypothetical protein
VRGSPVTETCVKRGSNRGQGPIPFLLLYRGSSPFTHCGTSAGTAPPVPVCATSAGTAPPVPVTAPLVLVLRHQCRYCATSAGTAPPVPVTAPPVLVLRHKCRYCTTSAGAAAFLHDGNYPKDSPDTQTKMQSAAIFWI